jgi:hypothetical protein
VYKAKESYYKALLRVAFFAIPGLRTDGAVFRSGGQRKLALPEGGPDPTDAEARLVAFLARRRELAGERRLVLAVFQTSLDDLARYPRSARQYAEAYRWLTSDDECWPLAFVPACTTLDLDPGAVRKHVLAVYWPPILPGPGSVRPTRGVGVRRGRPPMLVCAHAL